jgi:hypothetical protein
MEPTDQQDGKVDGAALNNGHAAEAPTAAEVVTGWLIVLVGPDTVVERRALEHASRPDGWTDTIAGYYDGQHLNAMAAKALDVSPRSERRLLHPQPAPARAAGPLQEPGQARQEEGLLRRGQAHPPPPLAADRLRLGAGQGHIEHR